MFKNLLPIVKRLKFEAKDIIHGDIKPENILISRAENSAAYVAQVADFGYSTIHTDHPICTPRSRGWTAPEWHHRGFKYLDAEKIDVYSFGLLCLWLFSFDEQEYISDRIRAELPAIVDELLIEEATQAETLKRALRLSLERSPASRPTFSFLSQLLESTRYSDSSAIVYPTLIALSGPVLLLRGGNIETSESRAKFAVCVSLLLAVHLYNSEYSWRRL